LSDEERQYIYRNRKGKLIYKPVYQKYNEYFFENIIEETSIKAAFNALKDTSLIERFMLNAAQFSAAKSAAEAKLMQVEVFGKDGVVRTYPEFEKAAKQITDISQKTWLRVEYESQRRQCVMGEQFRQMMEDKDLYPYWIYKGVMDDRERPEHVELEGKVFRIGEPEGDDCFPPGDWNCRCEGEAVDDDYLDEKGLKPVSREEAKQLLEENVDEQFRSNPAIDGTMPSTGSYFEVLGSANDANAGMFGLDDIESDSELEGLAAKGLHHLLEVVHEWRKNEPVNKAGDIIFQHKPTLTNVRFTNNSLHTVQQHSRGFENIPATIKAPDEVWASWQDPGRQRVVLRNYIKFGKTSYVVQTRDGVIVDAFAESKRGANKYRKGVIV